MCGMGRHEAWPWGGREHRVVHGPVASMMHVHVRDEHPDQLSSLLPARHPEDHHPSSVCIHSFIRSFVRSFVRSLSAGRKTYPSVAEGRRRGAAKHGLVQWYPWMPVGPKNCTHVPCCTHLVVPLDARSPTYTPRTRTRARTRTRYSLVAGDGRQSGPGTAGPGMASAPWMAGMAGPEGASPGMAGTP